MSAAQQRAVRRFYLRLLLGAYLGVPGKDVHIERRIKGKPELDQAQSKGELDFNVSRSGGSYLIGISSGAAIGVDLEDAIRESGRPMALAQRYFSQMEIDALSRCQKQDLHRDFIRTWACKEAMVKANGLGIANQLCRFSVDVDPTRPPSVLDMLDDDPSAWQLALAQPMENTIAAVAVKQKSIRLQGFSLS
jgi:4'-phosphopantetheinyl transferase